MRLRNDYASDVNPPLVPEWPSLTARARGAPGKNPARGLRRLEPSSGSSSSHNGERFEVTFMDQSLATLKINFSSLGGWMLWLGGEPRAHDLLMSEKTETLSLAKEGKRYVIKPSRFQGKEGSTYKGFLSLSEENGSLEIYDSNGELIWRSVGVDLLVGDVSMNFPMFRHGDGFGMSLDMGEERHIVGGGEQFGATNLQGRIYDVMNSDALGVGGNFVIKAHLFL